MIAKATQSSGRKRVGGEAFAKFRIWIVLPAPSLRLLLGLPVALGEASWPATLARAQESQPGLVDQMIQPPSGAGGASAFQPGVSIRPRAAGEYDPAGVRFGDITVNPEIDESFGYDGNVLGTARPRGSVLEQTTALLRTSADWPLARAQTLLTVDDVRYINLPGQSYTNWSAQIGGSYQSGKDVIAASVSHQALTQTPASLDAARLPRPFAYTIDDADARYRVNLDHVFLTPGIGVAAYSFASEPVAGTSYRQNYRDRVEITPSLTTGYALSNGRDVVAVLRNSVATYSYRATGLARRDYNDTAFLLGFDYDADSVLRYRLLIGYEIRRFQSRTYKTIGGPVLEASAAWQPTDLTTVTASVARRVEDSSDVGSAAYTESYARLRVEHEYLPNVALHAQAGIYLSQYAAGGGAQTLYTAGFGATYLMNRNMRMTLGYDFTGRGSGGAGGGAQAGGAEAGGNGSAGTGFTDHRIVLQLRLLL